MSREHVRIAIPVSSWNVTPQIFAYVKELEVASADPAFKVRFTSDIISGYAPVEFARNTLVGNFLRTDASRLWFMDCDVIPNQDAIELLDVDADIVAGTYPILIRAEKGPAILYGAYVSDGEGYKYVGVSNDQGVMDVDAVLNGMTVIRRRVLEDRRLWHDPAYVNPISGRSTVLRDDEAPPIFRTFRKPNGEQAVTEDFEFCKRAKDLGYSIKLKPNVRCGHVKLSDLEDSLLFGEAAFRLGEGRLKSYPLDLGVMHPDTAGCQ